mmetsp:Transcript_52748/g.103129  ORF Transcript_52748/g.103129 Transcript_52748/m.103129 type:complete len:140 (-) Transcript_52748:816-1235(-)
MAGSLSFSGDTNLKVGVRVCVRAGVEGARAYIGPQAPLVSLVWVYALSFVSSPLLSSRFVSTAYFQLPPALIKRSSPSLPHTPSQIRKTNKQTNKQKGRLHGTDQTFKQTPSCREKANKQARKSSGPLRFRCSPAQIDR